MTFPQKKSRFYDITVPLSPRTAGWPGGVKYSREELKGSAIVSTLTIRSHYATHVDAPKHFLFDKKSIDKIPVNVFVGKYKVFEIKNKKSVGTEEIKKLDIRAGDRILFKTRNSKFVTDPLFHQDYVSLEADAAKFLARKKVLLVGIDYFGIEAKGSPGHPVHKTLLSANVIIVEGVDLKKVRRGTYDGAILPLKVDSGDGAPARAVLWK